MRYHHGRLIQSLSLALVVAALSRCGGSSKPSASASDSKSTQSMKDVTELICNVDQRAGIAKDADVMDAEAARHEYLNEHITNPDGIYLYTLLRAKDPKESAQLLQQQVKDVGLTNCERLKSLQASATD